MKVSLHLDPAADIQSAGKELMTWVTTSLDAWLNRMQNTAQYLGILRYQRPKDTSATINRRGRPESDDIHHDHSPSGL